MIYKSMSLLLICLGVVVFYKAIFEDPFNMLWVHVAVIDGALGTILYRVEEGR